MMDEISTSDSQQLEYRKSSEDHAHYITERLRRIHTIKPDKNLINYVTDILTYCYNHLHYIEYQHLKIIVDLVLNIKHSYVYPTHILELKRSILHFIIETIIDEPKWMNKDECLQLVKKIFLTDRILDSDHRSLSINVIRKCEGTLDDLFSILTNTIRFLYPNEINIIKKSLIQMAKKQNILPYMKLYINLCEPMDVRLKDQVEIISVIKQINKVDDFIPELLNLYTRTITASKPGLTNKVLDVLSKSTDTRVIDVLIDESKNSKSILIRRFAAEQLFKKMIFTKTELPNKEVQYEFVIRNNS